MGWVVLLLVIVGLGWLYYEINNAPSDDDFIGG